MVPIRENLVPKDKYAIKCPYTRTPTRVVIHNTANDAPAANEISYMRYNDLEISFHYAVDDVNIVQHPGKPQRVGKRRRARQGQYGGHPY